MNVTKCLNTKTGGRIINCSNLFTRCSRLKKRLIISQSGTFEINPTVDYMSNFLDASSHLYKSVCPSVGRSVGRSVGPSVGPSVGLSVGPSVCNAFVKNARKSFISPILSLPFNALGLFMPF